MTWYSRNRALIFGLIAIVFFLDNALETFHELGMGDINQVANRLEVRAASDRENTRALHRVPRLLHVLKNRVDDRHP